MPDNNNMMFLIKFDPETGERLSTIPFDNDITPEKAAELQAEGYELIPYEVWNLLIGNVDGKEYVKDVAGGGYIEKPQRVPTLQEAQTIKITELKATRDAKETEPIFYNGASYDFDTKSFDRISAAIIALDGGGSIGWTTADNTVVSVTANDLRGVIAAAAVRSNRLHVVYRELKAVVMAASTNKEVEEITWEEV